MKARKVKQDQFGTELSKRGLNIKDYSDALSKAVVFLS